MRISFGKNPIGGWIHESGLEYDDREGQSFGFSKDHTNGARSRTANGNALLDNLILFNPDKKSQWCQGDTESTVSCEEAKWTIRVEPGTYEVKLTFGDSEIAARHDL